MTLFRLFKRMRGLFLIVLFGFILPTWAVQTNNKFWSSFTLNGNYGTFLYHIEPQLRLIDASKPFNQFLTNAGGGYQVAPSWQLWLGQTISTISQDTVAGDYEEYRFWEQAVWQHNLATLSLISRSRVEQRKSFYFAEWANRFRERLLINIPLTDNFSLVTSDEFFINLNQVSWVTTKTWDQNRAYIGLTQQLSKSTFLSVGYMNQWIFSPILQSDRVFVVNLQINLPT
jgi:hypothetical protein